MSSGFKKNPNHNFWFNISVSKMFRVNWILSKNSHKTIKAGTIRFFFVILGGGKVKEKNFTSKENLLRQDFTKFKSLFFLAKI